MTTLHRSNDFSKEKVDTRNYRNSQQDEREKEVKENVGKTEKSSYSEPEKPEKSTYEKQYNHEQKKPLSEDELELLKRREEIRNAREESKGDDFDFVRKY